MSAYFFDNDHERGRLYLLDNGWFRFEVVSKMIDGLKIRGSFSGTADFLGLNEDEKNRALRKKK